MTAHSNSPIRFAEVNLENRIEWHNRCRKALAVANASKDRMRRKVAIECLNLARVRVAEAKRALAALRA